MMGIGAVLALTTNYYTGVIRHNSDFDLLPKEVQEGVRKERDQVETLLTTALASARTGDIKASLRMFEAARNQCRLLRQLHADGPLAVRIAAYETLFADIDKLQRVTELTDAALDSSAFSIEDLLTKMPKRPAQLLDDIARSGTGTDSDLGIGDLRKATVQSLGAIIRSQCTRARSRLNSRSSTSIQHLALQHIEDDIRLIDTDIARAH